MRRSLNLISLASTIFLLLTGCTLSHSNVRLSNAVPLDIVLTEKLGDIQSKIDPNLRICTGRFDNRTGQFKDLSMLRYSNALTQGAEEVLYHALYIALGSHAVLERDRENLKRIEEEYKMSYLFDKKGRRVGLIQRAGPEGGITGTNFLVSGAITSYNVARYSGGGGINIDGIGVNVQQSVTELGVELRLTEISTSQVVWSTRTRSRVSGEKVGADMMRFITAGGDQYLVSLEAGAARQMPAYFALQDCIAQGIQDMIRDNDMFLAASSVKKTGGY
ncbi:MAG: hypothetical protein JRC60_07740 [Deltaproteobacteria bacterium]|nr:hypothetical protein [Deltaproteobacteria bacterium]